ncbi:NUDIX domain-containing protein [Frankia canadensis]|nr:NUDIX hydrolase [Frankia canadensis]
MTTGRGSHDGEHCAGRAQRTPDEVTDCPVGDDVPTVIRAVPTDGLPPMARPYTAAGALFFDEDDRVLLVDPSYKPGWDIPGGFVEPGESPYAACVREVEEELGITPPIGDLLAVDWAPRPKDGWLEGEMLLFVFDGGLLPPSWRERIQLGVDELVAFAFVPLGEVDGLLPPLHARRVAAAARLRRTSRRAGYLEYGDLMTGQSAGLAPADHPRARRPQPAQPGG